MLAQFERDAVRNATYGRAAKTIAIYLKTTVVTGGHADHRFARLLHPPIDSRILEALSRDGSFSPERRRRWGKTAWSTLDELGYFALIESLREESLDRPAFWHVERYWQP